MLETTMATVIDDELLRLTKFNVSRSNSRDMRCMCAAALASYWHLVYFTELTAEKWPAPAHLLFSPRSKTLYLYYIV